MELEDTANAFFCYLQYGKKDNLKDEDILWINIFYSEYGETINDLRHLLLRTDSDFDPDQIFPW